MGSVKTLKVTATKTFQRDIKKLTAKQQFSVEMTEVLYLLQRNRPLPKKYLDHSLQGEMQGYRDCHIFNDLVLIYQIIDDEELKLIRIGSHSEIHFKRHFLVGVNRICSKTSLEYQGECNSPLQKGYF